METEGPRVRASPASLRCGPWARHIYPSLVLVQPRKNRPYITERLLMGRKESNQTKTPKNCSINIAYFHFPPKMNFNIVRTYAQLLCRSCYACNTYLKYILDSVSELNRCYIGGRWHRMKWVFAPSWPLTWFWIPGTFPYLASTPIVFTTHV